MKTKLSVLGEKIIEAGWLAIAIIAPLFFNPYSKSVFELNKAVLIRIVVSVMVLAWIIWIIETRTGNSSVTAVFRGNRWRTWLKTPLFLPVLILSLVYGISAIFSVSPQVSVWGSHARMQGIYSSLSYVALFALIAGFLRTRKQVDRLVTAIILTSIPISLYAIIQHYNLDFLPFSGDTSLRVTSSLGNAIALAGYLIMVIPLTLSRLVEVVIIIFNRPFFASIDKGRDSAETLSPSPWTTAISTHRGQLVLVALYIFILGIQLGAIVFSQSRGPVLGLLGAGFVMGLLCLLMIRGRKGWLWLGWLGLAAVAISLIIALNIRGTPFDPYLDPIRNQPYINRFSTITTVESGSTKVRTLLWDSAIRLASLDIPDGALTGQGRFSSVRPLIGYGPETLLDVFPSVHPAELYYHHAQKNQPNATVDRSHNQIIDTLITMGILGVLAFCFLLISLLFYALVWLGLAPNKSAKRWLLASLILSGLSGAFIAYVADNSGSRFTFVLMGFSLGLVAGVVVYLIRVGFTLKRGKEEGEQPGFDKSENYRWSLLLIGTLGAIIANLIELQFAFFVVPTATYFWVYAGLLVALARLCQPYHSTLSDPAAVSSSRPGNELNQLPKTVPNSAANPAKSTRLSKRKGKKQTSVKKKISNLTATRAGTTHFRHDGKERWEIWLGSYSLVVALIFVVLTFDIVMPQESAIGYLLSIIFITGLSGLIIGLSYLLNHPERWSNKVNITQGVLFYVFVSTVPFLLYLLAHQIQLTHWRSVPFDLVLQGATVLANMLVLFYIYVVFLLGLVALTLIWHQMKGLLLCQSRNWQIYLPLALAFFAVIWFKNVNMARADIYYQEGMLRYGNNGQWRQAILLHEKAHTLNQTENFYTLNLAKDFQLLAQKDEISLEQKQFASQQAQLYFELASQNAPYSPEIAARIGGYYFNTGLFDEGLGHLKRAVSLAPFDITKYNSWAQGHYNLQQYEPALELLEKSRSIDDRYPDTWLWLGDVFIKLGRFDEALRAHSHATKLRVGADDGLSALADHLDKEIIETYVTAGRFKDIKALLKKITRAKPNNIQAQWATGLAYALNGQPKQAVLYFEQARASGDISDKKLKQLGEIYLELNQPEKALPLYLLLAEKKPTDKKVNNTLTDIYRHLDQLDKAIHHNQQVLEQSPDNYNSLKNLALLYQEHGDWAMAVETAQRAVLIAPGDEQPGWQKFIATELVGGDADSFALFVGDINQYLQPFINSGQLENVVAAMQQTAQERPNDAQVQWAVGYAYQLSEQWGQAIPHLERARELGDESNRTLKQLAKAYFHLDRLKEALPLYELWTKKEPSNPQVHFDIGYIYGLHGDLDKAIQHTERVLELVPENYPALKNLVLLYRDTDQWSAALKVAEQAKTVAPETELPIMEKLIREIKSQQTP